MTADGTRKPRPLPSWEAWVTCFDAVQLNGDEMDLLRRGGTADAYARRVLALGPSLVSCTLGSAGARCWSTLQLGFGEGHRGRRDDGSVVSHEIPAHPVAEPDPTGCGDVWAGVMCCGLLSGDEVPVAAGRASRLAAAAARQSGVTGLVARLKQEATAAGKEDL